MPERINFLFHYYWMKYLSFIGTFFLLFFLPSAHAQQTATGEQSMLWEINGKKWKKPSYLYGTIHLLPKEDFLVKAKVESRFKKADKLVLEVVLDMGAIFSMAFQMGNTPEQDLKELLTPEEYQRTLTYCRKKLKMTEKEVNASTPMALSQQVMGKECNLSAEGNASYEIHFMKMAKQQDKPMVGLETIKQQMAFLNGIPLKDQAKGLMQTIDRPQEACGEYRRMLNYYKSEQLDSLNVLVRQDEQIGGSSAMILDQRNESWIPQIEKMGRKQSLFIAVGAGHLGGEKGVIALLRQRGYMVKAIH